MRAPPYPPQEGEGDVDRSGHAVSHAANTGRETGTDAQGGRAALGCSQSQTGGETAMRLSRRVKGQDRPKGRNLPVERKTGSRRPRQPGG